MRFHEAETETAFEFVAAHPVFVALFLSAVAGPALSLAWTIVKLVV